MKYNYPLNPKDVWKENPELKSVPEYARLSAKQMCFVMLVGDPTSPHIGKYFKQDGEQEFFRSACVGLGFSDKRGNLSREGEEMVFDASQELQIAIQVMRDSTGFELVKGVVAAESMLDNIIKFSMVSLDSITDTKEKKVVVGEMRQLIKDKTISNAMSEVQATRAVLGMIKEEDEDDSEAESEGGKQLKQPYTPD